MSAIPSSFPVHRSLDELQTATSKALAQQYTVGYRRGKFEAWLCMGALGMCCFLAGAVFVVAFSKLVLGAML